MEFLDKLGVVALGSRLKRASDLIMSDGLQIYQAANIDFDPKWFPVYRLLAETSPLGIVEIAEQLQISHPYVIKLVKELEKKGLVTNTTDTADGRKRAVKLSQKGLELLNKINPIWNDVEVTLENILQQQQNNLYADLLAFEKVLEAQSFKDHVLQTRKNRLLNEVKIIRYDTALKTHFKTLNFEWLEKYFEIEPIDHTVLGDPETHIIGPGGAIIFAELHGEIVGTCALKKKADHGYELTKMAVTDKAQGLQIGKKLGLEIIRIGKEELNAELIFLESNRKLVPAITLYKKLGFVEKVCPWPSDYERSNIYMELVN